MEETKILVERRLISGFDKLLFKSVGHIDLCQGETVGLAIEGPTALRERVITEVIDHTLIISNQKDWYEKLGISLHGTENLHFHLCMPVITGLIITGKGWLSSDSLHTEALNLELAGSGSIKVDRLVTTQLAVKIVGTGSIQIAGEAEYQSVQISGAGSYHSSHLESEHSLVELSGVGNASVYARKFLEVAISGAGGVEYHGHPQVTRKICGLGMLKYVEDYNYLN